MKRIDLDLAQLVETRRRFAHVADAGQKLHRLNDYGQRERENPAESVTTPSLTFNNKTDALVTGALVWSLRT